jgi:hypothetical protein
MPLLVRGIFMPKTWPVKAMGLPRIGGLAGRKGGQKGKKWEKVVEKGEKWSKVGN